MMYQKLKGLLMESGNLAKSYVTENKIVSLFLVAGGAKKIPPKSDCKAGML
jgi:hypothetical protein